MHLKPVTKTEIEEAQRVFHEGLLEDFERAGNVSPEYLNARARLATAWSAVIRVKLP